MCTPWIRVFSLFFFTLLMTINAYAWDRGIYLTQYTIEDPKKLDYFIKEAKEAGINTFVVDHEYYNSRYAPAIAKIKAAGIKCVARVVVFSDGGNAKQLHDQSHWEKKLALALDAIKAGVDAIQLDYIRYSSKMPANPQHAKDVYQVIKWFKGKINAKGVPMEIDIFGEVSYHPSLHIGQDIELFADSVDGVNPMVYPSHFWPYQKYSAEPYKTINNSLNSLSGQFDNKPPFKIHAFIEAANYHYISKTSSAQKQAYLLEEIRAVENAKGVSGWYVWSANNVYDNLFKVLKENKTKMSNDSKVEAANK
ncbi:MAG TPA: putative glycoside hydrolase [Gammaproteobacteria bacterium]|nr:putative glycoside hydrolase [Gammaproteobacteria bacterium]